jgi:hypothetical protein
MQQLKNWSNLIKFIKKHKDKEVTHDKLKTGNKLNNQN